MRVLRDVEYSDRAALDAYVPEAHPEGVTLLLHGGWLGRDKKDEETIAERLCAAGQLVFVANYRLGCAGPCGHGLDDVLSALNWIESSDFLFDRDRVAVMGHGIGGTLAIEMGLAKGIPVVAWSAVIDIKSFMDLTATLGDSDHLRDYENATWDEIRHAGEQIPFLRGVVLTLVQNNLSRLSAASPLARVNSGAGPMLLFNSFDEWVPAAGATLLQQRLTELGIACQVNLAEGTAHGPEYFLRALPATLHFLRTAFAQHATQEVHANDVGFSDEVSILAPHATNLAASSLVPDQESRPAKEPWARLRHAWLSRRAATKPSFQ